MVCLELNLERVGLFLGSRLANGQLPFERHREWTAAQGGDSFGASRITSELDNGLFFAGFGGNK